MSLNSRITNLEEWAGNVDENPGWTDDQIRRFAEPMGLPTDLAIRLWRKHFGFGPADSDGMACLFGDPEFHVPDDVKATLPFYGPQPDDTTPPKRDDLK